MSSLDFRELLFHMRPSYDSTCIPVVKLPLIFVDGNMSNVALRRCLSKLNLFQVEYILTKQYNLYLHTPVTFMPRSEHGVSQQLSVVGVAKNLPYSAWGAVALRTVQLLCSRACAVCVAQWPQVLGEVGILLCSQRAASRVGQPYRKSECNDLQKNTGKKYCERDLCV